MSPQVASVAQPYGFDTGSSFACISQPSTIGSRVKDSGASNHNSGNKSQSLPAIILSNGIQTKSKGVTQANPTLWHNIFLMTFFSCRLQLRTDDWHKT